MDDRKQIRTDRLSELIDNDDYPIYLIKAFNKK